MWSAMFMFDLPKKNHDFVQTKNNTFFSNKMSTLIVVLPNENEYYDEAAKKQQILERNHIQDSTIANLSLHLHFKAKL